MILQRSKDEEKLKQSHEKKRVQEAIQNQELSIAVLVVPMFKPPTHKIFPVTGVFTGFLSVGIWYSCTSQHMVQRILSAKDEWNARMGVVCAGFLHIIMPFFFIVPGIIALKMFPNLPHPDMAYLELVKELIPTGLKGLLLAGMAAALMSHVSAVLNSASTI